MKYVYPACFYPQDDGIVVVDFPDLGCTTQGDGLADAIRMAADCAAGWIIEELEKGEKLPDPTEMKLVQPDEETGFVSLVYVDMDELAANYDNKPVKKTLTIPSWLNQAAEKQNINFSATLKDAILEKISK
jgi:predicted RNase H-like HicB family nuclease